MSTENIDSAAPILDTNVLEELHSIVEDEFTDILQLYLDESTNLMSDVHSGFENGNDLDSLTRAVHTFKSTSNYLGAKKVSCLAEKMENLLRSEKCDSARKHLDELQDSFTKTHREMKIYMEC